MPRVGNQKGRRIHLVLQSQGDKRWITETPELSCLILYLRGSEPVIEGRLRGVNTVVIRARESAANAATTHWRFKEPSTGTAFNIKSMIPSHCGRWIDFTCETGVPT